LRELAKLDLQFEELNKKVPRKEGELAIGGELIDEMYWMEIEILEKFGLPSTRKNLKLVRFDKIPDERTLSRRINKLKRLAAEYLADPAKSPIEILEEAKNDYSNVFDVLPKLKIITHSYTNFVYEFILLNGLDTPENVWEELQLVQNTEGLLGLLGGLNMVIENYVLEKLNTAQTKEQRKEDLIKICAAIDLGYFDQHSAELAKYNLKYLIEYLLCLTHRYN